MRVEVKHDELRAESATMRERSLWLRAEVWRRLRAVSFAAERRVKDTMPVDTGRARASWGHWSGGDTFNPEASPGDALWKEDERDLAITQGSNLEYIGPLNDGHSSQAPRGFIDSAEDDAVRALDRQIDEIMGRF